MGLALGSFRVRLGGAQNRCAELQACTGRPTSSTSLAFVAACRALSISRVSVAASYPEDVAEHFVALLSRGGIGVTALGSHGIITAAEVGTLGYEQVEAIATGADVSGGAEAVLVPDTAMHSLQWVDRLEAAVGLPVLTANQVTVWQGLRLLGEVPRYGTLGTLFRTPSRG